MPSEETATKHGNSDDHADKQPNKRFKNNLVDKLKKDLENLQNAENYSQSNLFRLQLAELLKESCPSEIKLKKFKSSVDFLIKTLKNLKEKTDIKTSDLSVFGGKICIPLGHLCEKMEGTYSFKPPSDVRAIGSYATDTCIDLSSKTCIDLSVQMPKDFFTERDFLNYRYFVKRNLYLGHVYTQLMDKAKLSNCQFEFVANYSSSYKPLLLISFENSLEVCLHFVPHQDSFKLHRFNPNQSNIRAAWFFEKFKRDGVDLSSLDLEKDYPTPNYNYEILKDLRAIENNEILKSNLNTKGVKGAIQLLKLWIHKRELNKGYGAFDSFTISMFVMHLIAADQINPVMNEYQIFRTVLMQLSEAQWDSTGISIKANKLTMPEEVNMDRKLKSDEFMFEDHHKHFDVVFADHSGYLNICSQISRGTFLRVKSEARISLAVLNNELFNGFDELFIKSHSIEMSFDALISVNPLNDDLYYNRIVSKTSNQSQLMDKFNRSDIISLKPIHNALVKALDTRVSQVFFQLYRGLKWRVNTSCERGGNREILIGLTFNEGYDNVLIKGPVSTAPEAKDFRDFWGSKSELRRFHDTTIREAVYFEAANIATKRLVYSEIVKHIFLTHLSIEGEHLRFSDRQMNSLLSLPSGIVDNYGTGEEKLAHVVNAFNEFSTILKGLKDLPLAINNLNGISSIFRFTEVFAPLPCCFNYDDRAERNMCFKQKNKCFPKYPLGSVVVPYVKPLEIACQLESSGKWPENLECIKYLKSAFYLAIVDQVRNNLNLTAFPFIDHCDIVYKGFVFRLFVYTMSELFCLKMSKNEQGVLCTTETKESIIYEKRMTLIPRLNSFLHSIQQKYNSFSGVCRLVKRWLASQFLLDYFEEEAIDLMCAYFFVNPHAYEAPKSVITGFVRFLEFISNFDWKNQMMLINFNNEFQENDITEISINFKENRSKLPPVFIATPFDMNKKDSVWTTEKPSMQQLCRIVLLARQSLQSLKKSILEFESSETFKNIFRPNCKIFDVVINLKAQYCVKAFQKIDIVKGTFLPHYHDHNANVKVKELPVVDFDPVQIYLNDLRRVYGELAYFCSDPYGDTKVYVLWKPDALKAKELTTRNIKFRQIDPIKNMLELNVTAILDDFKVLGDELVENVIVKNESSIFK